MDSLNEKRAKEIEKMQHHTSRMLRNMSLAGMLPFESGSCRPNADVYESDSEFYLYMDLAGADPETLTVIADDKKVRIYGRRQLPENPQIACVHQLEIELGSFDRMITLPAPVDVDRVTSAYKNGILLVTLPKKQKRGKVSITVTSDE